MVNRPVGHGGLGGVAVGVAASGSKHELTEARFAIGLVVSRNPRTVRTNSTTPGRQFANHLLKDGRRSLFATVDELVNQRSTRLVHEPVTRVPVRGPYGPRCRVSRISQNDRGVADAQPVQKDESH